MLPVSAGLIAGGLLAIAPRSTLAGGFSHDSAYLDRLAQNLLAGHGLVNDALWPVFLMPAELPMPFHNQNPLYAILIALISRSTGLATVGIGFAVSAVAAAALAWGVAVIARDRFDARPPLAIGIGVVSMLYPPVWDSAVRYLPDMLCAALLVWCTVWLMRDGRWSPVAAGALLGLAWLTRSTATLAVPAMATYLLLAFGLRRGITRGIVMSLAVVLVVSPWLIYTASVWGSPFRSDAPFTVVSNYHAVRSFAGEGARYWHSAAYPATFGEVLRSEPRAWLAYWARSIPLVAKYFVKGLAGVIESRTSPAAVLALAISLLSAGALALQRRRIVTSQRNAVVAGLAVLFATELLVFGMLGRAFEVRYICLLAAAIAAMMAASWRVALFDVRSVPGAARVRAIAVVLAGVLLALFAVREDLMLLAGARATDPYKVAYFTLAREVAALDPTGAPVVVGFHPYFFSEATGRRALSVPLDDPDLESVMNRYHARYVALTDHELRYWRPSWHEGATAPHFLRVARHLEGGTVFERTR